MTDKITDKIIVSRAMMRALQAAPLYKWQERKPAPPKRWCERATFRFREPSLYGYPILVSDRIVTTLVVLNLLRAGPDVKSDGDTYSTMELVPGAFGRIKEERFPKKSTCPNCGSVIILGRDHLRGKP